VFFDGVHYGYSILELTRDAATFTIYAVDRDEDRADAARTVLRSFRVPTGQVAIEDVTPARTAPPIRDALARHLEGRLHA
jgi:alkaline phosphatase D